MQLGSVVYNNFAAGALGPGAANNGLSVSGGIVQLGGPLGSAGAAVLLNNREIPFSTFELAFTGLGTLEITNLCDGNGSGNFGITTNGGQTFIHTGNRIGSFQGSMYIGYQAGAAAISALGSIQSNLVIGQGALPVFTSAVLNNTRFTILGQFACQSQTTGQLNCVIGWASCNTGLSFTANVAVGGDTATNIDNGSSGNVAVGISALGAVSTATTGGITTANTCIAIGYQTLMAGGAGTWTNLIFIGANSGPTAPGQTISNTTVLGNGYTTNVSNVCVIGVGTAGQNTLIGPHNNQLDLGSKLQVFGSLAVPIVTTGVNYTVLSSDFTVIATAAGLTITSPAASSFMSRIICYVAQTPGTITLSIGYTSLAGVAGVVAIPAGTSVWVQSDGTNWQQIK